MANGAEGLGVAAPPFFGGLSLTTSLAGTYTNNKDLKGFGDTLGSAVGIQQGFQTLGKVNIITKAVSTWGGTALTGAAGVLGGLTYASSLLSLAVDPALDPNVSGEQVWLKRSGAMATGIGGAFVAAGAVCAFVPPAGPAVAAVLIPAGAVFMGVGGVMQNWDWISSKATSLFQNPSSTLPTAQSSHTPQPTPTATGTPTPQANTPKLTPEAKPIETPAATGTPEP